MKFIRTGGDFSRAVANEQPAEPSQTDPQKSQGLTISEAIRRGNQDYIEHMLKGENVAETLHVWNPSKYPPPQR